MGNEFIAKATPTYRKGWAQESGHLAAGDMFTREPDAPIWVAKLGALNGHFFGEGEYYALRVSGTAVVAYDGTRLVGRDENPPPALVASLTKAGGIAPGKVRKIHPLTGRADIDVYGV